MRVLELAKELRMDNKDLLRQLLEMGVDVRNHMSNLDPEVVEKVRGTVSSDRPDVVEEKRVTTKVIRRRRKKTAQTSDDGEAVDDAESAAEEPEWQPEADEAEPAVAQAKPEPEPEPEVKAKAMPEPELESEPAPKAQAKPEPEPESAPEPVAEAKAVEPEPEPAPKAEAKPGLEPKPEPKTEVKTEAAAQVSPEVKQGPVAERPVPKKEAKAEQEPRPEARAGKPEYKPEHADRPPRSESDKTGAKAEQGLKAKPKGKDKQKKKRRFDDEPAKIISRPDKPMAPIPSGGAPRPKPTVRPPRPQRPPAPGPAEFDPNAAPPPPKEDDQQRRRRKKTKRTGPGGIPDDEDLMRRAGARRKQVLDKADLYDGRARKGRGKGGQPAKRGKKTEVTTPKAIKRRIKVGETINVAELAKRMGIKATEVVARLMRAGMMVTVNQTLDLEDAVLVAQEFGFEVERVGFEEESFIERAADKPEDMQARPPVVTIMGHVDHGKTSLLDKIRQTNVTDGEAGGITQHVGAYDVKLPDGGQVVFVDTPGHAAFTEMRSRGAQVTDVVVLVVAADDGVMQQTVEAINHSKAADVPIVVAVNKIDKPGADPDKVRRELSEHGLLPEDWGGNTIFTNVSAKTGEGIPELLELLNLQAEIMELKANPDKPAAGRIIEARLDKGRGAMATVLVQEGTLRTGDAFVCGVHSGRVRALFDDRGNQVDSAGPSIPVEVQGFAGVPQAGDEFAVVEFDKDAKRIAEHRQMKKRASELAASRKASLESIMEQLAEGEVQELSIVVKADVQGSVEALVDALRKLGNEQVRVDVIHSATGAITETDVMLASASNAIIIGFNVRPTGKVTEVAEAEHVEIRTYDVIYQVVDDVNKALTGMLAPEYEEEVVGLAEVRDTFSVPKIGVIGGCAVLSGKVQRGAHARLLRDGVVMAKSKVSSLRRFKDDVKEVSQGFECGIGLENYNDIKVGDQIEVYVIHEIAATL